MKKLIYYNYNDYYNTVYNNYKRSPNAVKENGVVLNYLVRACAHGVARTHLTLQARSVPGLRTGLLSANYT